MGSKKGGQRRWAAEQEGALDRKFAIRRHTRTGLLTGGRAEKRRRPCSGEHGLRASERIGVVLTEAHELRPADKQSCAENSAAGRVGYEPAKAKGCFFVFGEY